LTPSGPSNFTKPWFATAFDELYLSLYAHRDQRDARRALSFLLNENVIRHGELGLDLCCGPGRHLVEMLGVGMSVVGIDLSLPLLQTAQVTLGQQSLSTQLVRGSMNLLPFCPESFGWVVNLFTSFGYFEQDSENERVLQDVSRVLKPGGRFLIDFLNPFYIQATLKPASEEVSPRLGRIQTRRAIEGTPPRVVKRMTLEHQGERREIVESVRLYSNDELATMLESAGLRVVRSWGEFGDRRLGEMAPRCILLAEKA